MFEAEVGDDVMEEDPTINALQDRVAAMLGKEAALFTCSATQSNQIAIRVHCSQGDELLINSSSHIGLYEAGAPAVISGVTVRKIEAARGILGVQDLVDKPYPDDPHFNRTRLVCLENTTNMGGGIAYTLDEMKPVSDWAHGLGLKLHLDGARLFNATRKMGYSPGDVGQFFDTVTLCFSKGLGCPMGAMIVGSKEEIHQAKRVRKMLGGGCRQVGIVGAAAMYALDHHVNRLDQDHENALEFARGISRFDGISLPFGLPETNLVFFDISWNVCSASEFEARLAERGVKIGCSGKQRMRAVTHLDVASEDIPPAIAAIEQSLIN